MNKCLFIILPIDVVINHIIPHLSYKERTKLYCTCAHFWKLNTGEYIYHELVSFRVNPCNQVYYHMDKRNIGFVLYYSDSAYRFYNMPGNGEYYDAHKVEIRKRLDTYCECNKFESTRKKQKIK